MPSVLSIEGVCLIEVCKTRAIFVNDFLTIEISQLQLILGVRVRLIEVFAE